MTWLDKIGDAVDSVNPFSGPKKVTANTDAINQASAAAKNTQGTFETSLANQQNRTVAPTQVQTIDRAGVANVAAPVTAAPTVNTAGLQTVSAGPAVGGIAGQVGSVQTPGFQAESADVAQAKALALQAAQGTAPSAAQVTLQQANEANINAQQAALAGQAFNPAAQRNIQNQAAIQAQQTGQQVAALRAQEMAQGRTDFGNLATTSRGQVLQATSQDAGNQLAALSADQQSSVTQRAQNLQAQGMNADQALKVALTDQSAATQVTMQNAENNLRAQLANQGVDLDVLKSNAAMGNQAALADLDAKLRVMGMDDAMRQTYLNGIVALQGQQGQAAGTAAQLVTNANIANTQAETQQKGALIGAVSTLGAGFLAGPAAAAVAKK